MLISNSLKTKSPNLCNRSSNSSSIFRAIRFFQFVCECVVRSNKQKVTRYHSFVSCSVSFQGFPLFTIKHIFSIIFQSWRRFCDKIREMRIVQPFDEWLEFVFYHYRKRNWTIATEYDLIFHIYFEFRIDDKNGRQRANHTYNKLAMVELFICLNDLNIAIYMKSEFKPMPMPNLKNESHLCVLAQFFFSFGVYACVSECLSALEFTIGFEYKKSEKKKQITRKILVVWFCLPCVHRTLL